MLLFSGSLYLRLAGVGAPGFLAPAGGLMLMSGWICCIVGALARGR
jgi:uncharacterized membrane protein YgdD (TMEM256/DUF423 family)